MQLSDLNPFLRYAGLQPRVLANVPPRRAYDYRIFYILEGRATFTLEDQTIALSPGSVIYFRPGIPYSFDGDIKAIVLNFDMTRKQAERTEPRSPVESLTYFDRDLIFENDPPKALADYIFLEKAMDVEEKIRECLVLYCYPSPCSDAISSALLKQILCLLVQERSNQQPELPEIVRKVLSYLQQNYDRDVNNDQISAEFGYHSFYLNRMFKKCTGMTLHQALIGERIRVAKRMLLHSGVSVQAVALECGFSDRSQFCTTFRKHTGFTPAAYRKRHQTSNPIKTAE